MTAPLRTADEQIAFMLEHLALPAIRMVHDGDIDDVDGWLSRYDEVQLRQLCIILAALADPAVPAADALGWLLRAPANVIPLHRDEDPWDAPPMRAHLRAEVAS